MSAPATAEQLFETLRKLQEPKGYHFNADMEMTMSLLENLIATRDRYGYMACPCRLANGTFAQDRDIVCPCVYREEDVREYGACFCGLYVSREWNEGKVPHVFVPERRPPEKIFG